MKVFISWSGERSRQVAELLDDWIQCVIQAANPWMSSKDIDRGALWFNEINDQLANTSIGVVCLTKENKNKPWILFESGALAKGLTSSRVCTFLIDLEPTDLENPLAQFNHTFATRDGVWGLVRTINLSLKEKALKEAVIEKVFNTYWQQFETKFNEILKTTPITEASSKRDDKDIMLDVLSTVRMLDKRIRNIENVSDFGFDSRKKAFDRMPPELASNQIKAMLSDNMPEDLIHKILQDEGVPKSYVQRQINEFADFIKRDSRQ